jgi:hypothetical protein
VQLILLTIISLFFSRRKIVKIMSFGYSIMNWMPRIIYYRLLVQEVIMS